MAQCYDWNPETSQVDILSDYWVQCPSGNTCCVSGSECLDYNLCHTPGGHSGGGSYSSYYVARCSDPTYTSPDCQKVCNAPGPPDAVYNFTSTQWNCCGLDATGNVSCDNPSSEVFQAPAPASLATLSSQIAVVSTATLIPGSKTTSATASTLTSSSSSSSNSSSPPMTTATTATATATTNPSSDASSSSPSDSTSNGLSSGAKAGIGIGVALGIIALLAVLAFTLLRRRRRNGTVLPANETQDLPPPMYNDGPTKSGYTNDRIVVHEKPAHPTQHSAELPGEAGANVNGLGWDPSMGPVHEIGSSR